MSDLQPTHADQTLPISPLVFIVDDEPTVGMMIEALLQMDGYRAASFEDPIAALASFRETDPKPDLLITDYRMLGLTGGELISQCKVIHPSLRTILLSGYLDEASAESLIPPPDQFIKKPFFPAELLKVVKALMVV